MLHLLAAAEGAVSNTHAPWVIEHIWIVPLLAALSFPLTLAFGKRLPGKGQEIGLVLVGAALALSIVGGAQWFGRGDIELHHGPGDAHATASAYTGTAAGDTPTAHHDDGAGKKHAEEKPGAATAEEGGHGEEVEPLHVRPYYEKELTWYHNGGIQIGFGFHIDGFALVMLFTVCFISFLVHLYSTEYLRGDIRQTHYFAALGLFTAGMLLMVSASTTLQIILGWEIMGLCSFMLIGHWWEQQKNSNAALKAFFTTRTGDIGLLVGMTTLFFAAGQTFNIAKTNQLAIQGDIERNLLIVAAAALFVACIGKSAQFPLHTWLPDAMAGPTPASSLIHAATMVVAGVYMVARLYPVFFSAFNIGDPTTIPIIGGVSPIAIIGGITLLIAGGLAFVQTDIKKVLAYSTVAQLGYMVMGLGVGAWTGAIFHLFTHAFFKALLFMGAGSIAHGCFHSFEMEDYGGLRKYMPKTFATFMIGTGALMALPPLAGFWSKDEIVLGAAKNGFAFFFLVGSLGAVLTCAYMTRVVYKTFYGEYTGPHTAEAIEHASHAAHGHDDHAVAASSSTPSGHGADDAHDEHAHTAAPHGAHGHGDEPLGGYPHESPWNITVPLIALAVMSCVTGIINAPFAGLQFTHFTAIEPIVAAGVPEPHFDIVVAAGSTAAGLVGLALAYLWWFQGIRFGLDGITQRNRVARAGYLFLVNKYYLDHLYERVIVHGIKGPIAAGAYWLNMNVLDGVVNGVAWCSRRFGGFVYDSIDQAGVDGTVNGVGAGARGMGRGFKALATGRVQQYAALLIGGAAAGALVLYIVTIGELNPTVAFIDGTQNLDHAILSVATFAPIGGAVVLAAIPKKEEVACKLWALGTSIFTLLCGLYVVLRFDFDTAAPQLERDHEWISVINSRYHVFIDGMSLPLFLLSMVITVLCIIYSWNHWPEPHNPKVFLILMLILETGMLGSFVAEDLILFFVFFEIVLLPMYFMIGVWGGENRQYASLKFFLFTLFGSALMILSFLALYFKGGNTFDIPTLIAADLSGSLARSTGLFIFGGLFMGFAIKVPMFPFHTWLPDAHTQAPTQGSVILAAVLLKLGTYGFIRIAIPILPGPAREFAPWIAILATIGIIYGALGCLAQKDMKRLIAFSSVAHMGFVMLGIATLTDYGINAAIFGMVSHGLITGMLFFVAGSVKDRFHTLEISRLGGLLVQAPKLGWILGFSSMASLGLPGLAGFWGEFPAILSTFNPAPGLSVVLFRTCMVIASIGTVLAAGYLLWLFQRTAFGTPKEEWDGHEIKDVTRFEWVAWSPLLAGIVLFGVVPGLIFDITDPAVQVTVDAVRALGK